ncbi:MAG: PadR family transcriptional regulator [Conexivisphaerales archaeon]|nr:PadR family transcriptional regulator [Conexivisphaerales archaeon]
MWNFMLYKYKIRKFGGSKWLILALLSQGEKSGAEIMKEIEKLSFGFWRPSPGTIYPTLYKLIKEGYIVRLENSKYTLSEKGKEEIKGFEPITAESFTVDHVLDLLEGYVYYLKDIDKKEIEKRKDKIKEIAKSLEALAE